MGRKIIVIDVSEHLYPILLGMENVDITLLYVDSKREKKRILSQYPDTNVSYGEEATRWKKTFVSRDDINKYSHIQLKVERFAERFMVNSSYAMSQYYHALSFWLYQLNNLKVDCILVGGGMEHGSPIDSIPLELAKVFNIPAFIYENLFGGVDRFKAIRCVNSNKYVNLINLGAELVKLESVVRQSELCDDTHVFDVIFSADKPYIMKKGVRMLTNMCVGIQTCYYPFLHKKRCKYREKTKVLNRLYSIYCVLRSFEFLPSQKKNEVNALSMTVEDPNSKILSNAHSLKKVMTYYRKHSLKNVPVEQNCIIYALHYEPEATIMNRTVYNSQIYDLEMLSSCLPSGWKLYVKEHPQQFKSATLDPSYLKQVPRFRSKYFYQKLMNIENVELLDDRLSSSSLLDKNTYPNIRGFASINGTIALECLYAKKPIILFDVASTLYQYISGVPEIKTFDDLKTVVQNIALNGYIPDYGSFETILPEYLVRETFSDGSSGRLEISQNTLYNLVDNAFKYL